MTQAYPLQWPIGYQRTKYPASSRFKLSLADGRDFLLEQVRLLGGSQVVISSNAKLRNDGLPYSKQGLIADTGVALYFLYEGSQVAFACDKWNTIGGNIRALGLAIEASRALSRWGVSDMMNRAFAGFKQLPSAEKSCWDILQVSADATLAEIRAAYLRLAKIHHPDVGGSEEAFYRIDEAYFRARLIKQIP